MARKGVGRLIAGGVVAAMALAALATPAAAADARFTSGPLRVEVTNDPFALAFVDTADGDVLRTLGGPLPEPDDERARYGPLGYSFDLRQPVVNNAFLGYYNAAEVETVWFHATRVLGATAQPNRLVLDVATNDPLGHRLEVTVARAGSGGVTVESRIAPGSGPLAGEPSLSGSAFEAVPAERYLGFGERSNAVDQTGNRVFSWAEEGPFSSGEAEDLFRPLLPDFTFPSGPTATNFPIPWLVSTRGFGLLIDRPERSYFNLLNDRSDAWQAEAEAPALRLAVFSGPRPADVVGRYSTFAGRQPRPSPWIFGPWFQPTLESQPFELANRFRNEDVPVTLAQTYTHYLPCGAHRGNEQAERDRVKAYHSLGYKITTYFNPHVCTDYHPVYDQAAANGYFVKNQAGQPYVVSNPFTADEQVSEIDFTAPGATGFFQGLLDEAIGAGYDGWMEDFGEYTPTDSRFANGESGLRMHNRYPVLYHAASTAHTGRRGAQFAVFIRSGFHGVQPHARVVWGGDPTEDWSCADGLCAAIHQSLSIGLSGIAYWGSDIGGFHAVVNPRTDDELNIRWLQLGAVSGVMRTQANGFSFRNNRAERSQVWSPGVLPIWRRYTKLRTQLYPYIAGASEQYRRTGLPIARHMSLAFPADDRAIRQQEQFMFGPHLLAAPVIEPDARNRRLYLPDGQWVDLWRSLRYDQQRGAFRLRRARLLEGGRFVTVPAPLNELPLLARAGAVIPMLPSDVDTLADVGSGQGLVKLAQRRRHLRLLALPQGRSVTRIGTGERLVSAAGQNAWVLRLGTDRNREYRLTASLNTIAPGFRPCAVRLNGVPLVRSFGEHLSPARWHYLAGLHRLRVRFAARSGQLRVTPCR